MTANSQPAPKAARSPLPRAPLSVAYLELDRLKPDPSNARRHSAKQIRQIASSIEAFGFNVPILVDGDGNVIAGHGRLAAARRLGFGEIPAIRLESLSEPQKRAFMIADNRLAEVAVWDDRRLGAAARGSGRDRARFRPRGDRLRNARDRSSDRRAARREAPGRRAAERDRRRPERQPRRRPLAARPARAPMRRRAPRLRRDRAPLAGRYRRKRAPWGLRGFLRRDGAAARRGSRLVRREFPSPPLRGGARGGAAAAFANLEGVAAARRAPPPTPSL